MVFDRDPISMSVSASHAGPPCLWTPSPKERERPCAVTVAVTPGATSYGDCLRLLRTHVSTSSTIAAVERASNVVDQRNRIKVIEMHKVQGVEETASVVAARLTSVISSYS
jgi:hypothetical protein